MLKTKRLKIFFSLLSAALIASSCFNGIYTTNIQDILTYEEGSYIYALPRTCFKVKCTAIRSVYVAGPYAYKAEELLKLNGVKTDNEISWKINKVSIEACNEPDPEHFYSVKDFRQLSKNKDLLIMMNEGLVINPEKYSLDKTFSEEIAVDNQINQYSFNQPAINYDEVRNNVYNSTPYLADFIDNNNKLKEPSIIADEILQQRLNIEMLFINDDVIFPVGDAAVEGVKVFKEREEAYLSLFTGFNLTDTVTQYFYVYPSAKQDIQRHTLFKFSDSEGFHDANSETGKAVVLVTEDLNQTKHLDNLMLPDNSATKKNILFYRVPDKANVTLLNGSIPIAKVQLPVSQLGTIVPYFVASGLFYW